MVSSTNRIFRKKNLQLKDYPHMDAMVVEANIDGWVVLKILVDGGSSADIIFTATIDAMKIDRKLLGRACNTPGVTSGLSRVVQMCYDAMSSFTMKKFL
jgi:hypothetical protein